MNMIQRGFVGAAAMFATASLLAGCNTGGPDDQTAAVPTSKGDVVINGALLYSTEVRPGHLVEFYDFGDGATAVRESFPTEMAGEGVMRDKASPEDLASVFRLLNPNANVIPEKILAADGRAKLAAAENAKRGVPVGDAANDLSSSADLGVAPVLAAAASNCSSDVFGDSWGASWFLDNFCNERNIRICHTNRPSDSYSGISSSLRYKQMEGDFNVAGHLKAEHATYDCCFICACGVTWHTDFDMNIQPRHIEIITYTSSTPKRLISATSPCGHAHTAALHN